jgi:hypothetical protein
MRFLHALPVALVIVNCASPQEPAETLAPVSSPGTSFTSAFEAPRFEITMPVPQDFRDGVPVTWVWSQTLFKWKPVSRTAGPAQVRWIIVAASEFGDDFLATLGHIQTHPEDPRWSEWVDYRAPGDQGTSWYSPVFTDGRYVFALQARAKGLIDDDFEYQRNVRFLQVNHYQENGPLVRLSGTFLEPFETTGNRPPARIEVPAEASLQFAWTADASHLGSTIAQ